MRHSKWLLALLALGCATVVAASVGSVAAQGVPAQGGICGVIPTTLTIMENSRLTCDVSCLQTDKQPCIQFGRGGIKLSLNGFRMTGTANEPPRANCVTDSEFPTNEADGIHSKFDEVVVEGPGVVQRMKRHGIGLVGTGANPVEKVVVKKLVSHQNCFSGVFMGGVINTLVEEIVSARNGVASNFRPCGGVCVTNSHNNRIRRSEFTGTGSIATGGAVIPDQPFPNDFGVGLVGSSSGNIVEENGIGGNINGLALFPLGALTPTGNRIEKNVIVGNPPIEISADNPAINPVGSDVRDFSAPGSNTFKENLCMTYTGASPNPCTQLPQFAGHQNN
jgi:hypothetical protein